VLLPMPGGLRGHLQFAREQCRRHEAGLEPLPEEGTVWRYA
jgi:hypothetical protein